MNYSILFYFFALLISSPLISRTQTADPSTARLTAAQLIEAHKDAQGTDQIVGAQSKYNTPAGVQRAASYSCAGFLPIANVKVNHPSGGTLFPDSGALSSALDALLANLNQTPRFTSYFSKMHLFILHQLYAYLMMVYTNFTLTYYDSLTSYLQTGPQRAFIQKTTIIGYLINIIEAQVNQAVISRFPTMPQAVASFAGNLLMQQDQSTDLNLMLEQAEATLLVDPETQKALAPTLANQRASYLQPLGSYLRFFNLYTQDLERTDSIGRTAFFTHAKRIQQLMEQAAPKIDSSLSSKATIETLRTANTINPPMFLYTDEALRAINLIPALAASINKDTQPNPWPSQIVADATTGKTLHSKFNFPSAQPLAYFLDKEGNYTANQAAAQELYVNIPTTQYMFAQQILKEPAWLNTQQGVLSMTRACLGDFSQLLIAPLSTENILDPALTCILQNAAQLAKLPVSVASNSCDISKGFIKGVVSSLEAAINITPPDSGVIDTGADSGTGGSGGSSSTGDDFGPGQ